MASLIQRLGTVEVIEFMKEKKKAAFLLTQGLASSSKGPISSHLSAVSPLKDLLLYVIIHPSYNHLHNDHWGLKYVNVGKRRMTGWNRQTGRSSLRFYYCRTRPSRGSEGCLSNCILHPDRVKLQADWSSSRLIIGAFGQLSVSAFSCNNHSLKMESIKMFCICALCGAECPTGKTQI